MIPVQVLKAFSLNGREFELYILKIANNIYNWSLFVIDPLLFYSGGYSPNTFNDSPHDAFSEIIDFISKYLNARDDGDSIMYIDNPCNCELIDHNSQKVLRDEIDLSFTIKINGEEL